MDLENFIIKKEKELQKYKNILLELTDELNELLELEIIKFYIRYDLKNNNNIGAMFKTLSPKDLKAFKLKIKKFYEQAKKENWEVSYINKLKTLQSRQRISLIDSILIIIEHLIQSYLENEKNQILEILEKSFVDAFFNQLYELSKLFNIGTFFNKPSKQLIYMAIMQDWTGEGNLFNLIYRNNIKFIKKIRKELLIGLSLGENPNIVANRITDKTPVLKNSAILIARTEMIRIVNESSYQSFKYFEQKFDFNIGSKYSILATLDARTSVICQDMDGKIFDFKDKKTGVNFPPLHPNCRSSFKIVFDDDDDEDFYNDEGLNVRIARRLDNNEIEYVPSNINYKEWAKKFL